MEGGGVPLQPFHATSTTAHHTYIYYSSTVGVERNKRLFYSILLMS